MAALTVEINPDDETQRLIDQGIDSHNAERAGPPNAEDLWVIARDDGGCVRGGLKGRTSYSWLFIDSLWVSQSDRGQGLGSVLLEKAEAVARERGCAGAYLYTFSFQAPDFYARHGYDELGRIEGRPPGHASIWLSKRFPSG
jgi:GNAT superfamily N-acetyltransferase